MTEYIGSVITVPMITLEELRTRFRSHLKDTGEAQNALAKRLGIQQSSLNRFLQGKLVLSLDATIKILNDMGCSIAPPSSSENQTVDCPTSDIELKHQIEILQKDKEYLSRENELLRKMLKKQESEEESISLASLQDVYGSEKGAP